MRLRDSVSSQSVFAAELYAPGSGVFVATSLPETKDEGWIARALDPDSRDGDTCDIGTFGSVFFLIIFSENLYTNRM